MSTTSTGAKTRAITKKSQKKPFYKSLFLQVISGILLGVLIGCVAPEQAVAMKPLGDAFINLIKMMIAPIIFCTMVSGIAGMGNMKQVGRVGAKAILIFEILTTLALVIGWVLVDFLKPGSSFHIDVAHLDMSAMKEKIAHTGNSMHSLGDFFMNMIPSTLVSAFSNGEILQVLLVAIIFASALAKLGVKGKMALDIIESFSHVLFKMVDIITLAAPIGAFGAMAYTVGKFGVGSLRELGELIGIFYVTGALFIVLVLAPMMTFYCKLSPWLFLKYIREEIMIVLGTSSSETVLPRMMERLVAMGCSKPVVGLVIPAGYSFNLVGSSIYFTMGALFICYATATPITLWQEFTLLGVLLITSKGAAGVTGSAFLVLAATLSSMNLIPQANLEIGLALIFAIDRFMSTGRAIVNLIGNGMTTIFLAKWENELDHKLAEDILSGRKQPDLSVLEKVSPAATSLKAKLAFGETDEGRRKEQTLSISRQWLAAKRQKIKDRFLDSGDVAALLVAQTAMMDELLMALYGVAGDLKKAPVALIAVGGYGRAELFPYSDIDILFVYETKRGKEAAPIAEFILYVLWDLGLKVGQAHRNIDDTLTLAKSDMMIRTNLLDMRFVAGKRAVFTALQERYAQEIVAGTALEFVEAKLVERSARHSRFGESRYMLEPNVKEGKGGLRDLHTLWWLARYAYPIETLDDFVKMKLLTQEEYENFTRSRQFLWRVRAYLHYLTERAEERLTFDRQHAVAVLMGYPHPSANRSIERFMQRYFAAVRTVGSMTRIFCALLEEEKKRKPSRPLAWMWAMPWRLGHFYLEGERLNIRSDYTFTMQPWLMLELFHVAQENDLDIHPRALQLIARNWHLAGDSLRHDPRANALFLDIMLSDKGPEVALRRMSECGLLGRFIPDFGRVIGHTQFNMYHVYTVDEHTLVALGLLHALEIGEMEKEAPLASELIHRIKMRRVLYLSLFCHDIAKGQGADHSQLGEKVVAKLAKRMGFSADEIETCAWLVRYHLLFSNTAFKRDLNDPKTIADFVAMVQSPERLRLLLILTVADIRAVGPAVWNEWKAALMRDLYTRAEQAMGAGNVALPKHQAGQFRDDLSALLPGWTEADIDHYLEQGNPNFWASCDLPHHATIARLLKQAEHMTLPLLVDTRHDYSREITEILICTPDQHGLFSSIAGALSLAGANITGAKIFTLKSGMAIEIFQVQDAGFHVFDRPDRLAKMSVYIEQALSGELDLPYEISRRSSSYASASHEAMPVPGQVFIENDASAIYSVIEISGRDRSGFLYEITRAFAGLNLSIATAHISTYGTQVADVFYVKDIFGMKLTHATKQREVREALLKVVNAVT